MLVRRFSFLLVLACLLSRVTGLAAAAPGGKVSFQRDIKPLLSHRCFTCHGPDEAERKADLRLDLREEALKGAIKPGDAKASALYERITSTDPELMMPPPVAKKPLFKAEEAELIRRWIDEGAQYDAHWAYVPVTRPAAPAVKDEAWARGDIDRWILSAQEQRGLSPSADADKRVLLRRLSFDLIGLPATPAELAAFESDASPQAYEKVVNRLLASEHFGERMALYWLDVVRFADTAGYHSDNHRDLAPYRDYVIQAFNTNKPFDQFTREQLAGDLLPNATTEQRIASGYNRLLQTTEEGGAQAKEYTAKYLADRVRNTASIWMASTMGCCECHNHKFDPFTARDFYSLGAFFADVSEKGVGRQEQTKLPTPEQEQQLKQLEAKLAAAKSKFNAAAAELTAAQEEWEQRAADKLTSNGKSIPADIVAILKVVADKRSAAQKEKLTAHFRSIAPELKAERAEVTQLEQAHKVLLDSIPATLVSTSVAPRTVRILPRGNWLDDSGEVVQPAVPSFLDRSARKSDDRLSRLDFANWLLAKDNPLTARVFVNRLWKLYFGRGLCKSLEDFGMQGEFPTHPELLDWLAAEFVDSGWDVKHLIKLMVMSHTYQQVSTVSPQLREQDPTNFYFTRQNRWRIEAELVRDNALLISGLLVKKIGGPSVKPYQPAGYWQYLNFPKREWQNDKGENQYRRGLYTYWQRTFLHPSLAAFDASSREECTVQRPVSNTPQQALVLLNDPTYVEAARALAGRVVASGERDIAARLRFAYQQTLLRDPTAAEQKLLTDLYDKHLAEFQADEAAAKQLQTVGDLKPAVDQNAAELAAWTSVARVLLNLHETIVRE